MNSHLPSSAAQTCTFRQTFRAKLLLCFGVESTHIPIGKPSPAVDRPFPGASEDLVVRKRILNLEEFLNYLNNLLPVNTNFTHSGIKKNHKQSNKHLSKHIFSPFSASLRCPVGLHLGHPSAFGKVAMQQALTRCVTVSFAALCFLMIFLCCSLGC